MKIFLRYRYLVISSEDLSESRNLKIVNVNYPLAPLLIQISRLASLARNDSVMFFLCRFPVISSEDLSESRNLKNYFIP